MPTQKKEIPKQVEQDNNEQVRDDETFRNYLIAQIDTFEEGFWKSEEVGEKRIQFFIGLLTAVMAGLVAFGTADVQTISRDGVLLIVTFALFSLLAFGIFTWRRMIRRNAVTDEHKRAIQMTRGQLARLDSRIREHRPFRGRARPFWTGGLVDTMSLVNSILVAALVASLLLGFESDECGCLLLLTTLAFFVSLPMFMLIAHVWLAGRVKGAQPEANEK